MNIPISKTPRTDAMRVKNLGTTWQASYGKAIELARELEIELAETKVTADFWLAHEKQTNVEFERDYLAIWKAVKKPDLTVLESVLALVKELAEAKKDSARLVHVVEKFDNEDFHELSDYIQAARGEIDAAMEAGK